MNGLVRVFGNTGKLRQLCLRQAPAEAKPVDLITFSGEGHVGIVQAILEAGADPEAVHSFERTGLHNAGGVLCRCRYKGS